ncbi:MAG: class I SAM-dependent methyltransferase [Noviherbaspirillum sp.]
MNAFDDCASPCLETVKAFMLSLEATRSRLSTDEWRIFLRKNDAIRKWKFFLSNDPYTRWGLLKPRGYPGDATLMDFAYGHPSVLAEISKASDAGIRIYRHTSMALQSRSARKRIDLLAANLSKLGNGGKSAAVVSFAAGHSRELERLSESARGSIGKFTAIDLDAHSLETAQQSAGEIPFQPLCRNVLTGDFSDLPQADLVYSLGLFDYLNEARSKNVLEKMWKLVLPGGKLIIANLAQDAGNLAYCEAIMEWWMITRTEKEMYDLGQFVTNLDGSRKDVTISRHGCFFYLEIRMQG